jgi:hypothetical protein
VSNSTAEYWSIIDVDGEEVSLHQYGWAVTTVGGSRYDLPPRRGSDLTMAYRPGQIHRRKVPDARQMTLVMFMVGWDPATGDSPVDQRLQWNDNWDTLRRLVYRHSLLNDQRIKLTRRWFLTADTFPTDRAGTDICIQGDPGVPNPGPRLLTAFAFAEMTGNMDPTMTGRFRSDFQLDFTLADPFFYGDTVAVTMHPGDTTYVWNDGHDVAGSGYLQVDFYGPLTNPRITNLSTNPDSWVQYTGTIGSGTHLTMVVNRFQIVNAATNTNMIGKITNYGARFWVSLLPGVNKLQMTGSGSGNAVLSYRPPYV